jgi:hypothetical protein
VRPVSAAQSPKGHPLDAFRNVWFAGLYLLFWAAYLTAFWFVLGPSNPVYAVGVVGATWALTPAVFAFGLEHRVPREWFRVSPSERRIHRMLGVGVFGWMLDVSGWNRLVVKPLRRFSGRRAALVSLEQSVRANAAAHGTCFAIHVLLAVLALGTRHPWRGALWMLLPGVIPHLYPVLIQRAVMLRLQPLLDENG